MASQKNEMNPTFSIKRFEKPQIVSDMLSFNRKKRVTDPLDDEARARLVGISMDSNEQRQLSYVSSGSEHSAASDENDNSNESSPSLSELVHDFLHEDQAQEASRSVQNEFDLDPVESVGDCSELVQEISRSVSVNSDGDSLTNRLFGHVLKAVEMFSFLKTNRPVLRRNVMSFLRDLGYNAAICKTKWDTSGGATAGNYEFIDILIPSRSSTWQTRYIVDLDFASQFEIARPSSQYSELLRSLPHVYVGRGEDLKRTVKGMCDVAKRSLRSRDLSVPPWRKNRFMQNKWFASYKRTTNSVIGEPVVQNKPGVAPVSGIKCRFVGFGSGVGTEHGVFIRTR